MSLTCMPRQGAHVGAQQLTGHHHRRSDPCLLSHNWADSIGSMTGSTCAAVYGDLAQTELRCSSWDAHLRGVRRCNLHATACGTCERGAPLHAHRDEEVGPCLAGASAAWLHDMCRHLLAHSARLGKQQQTDVVAFRRWLRDSSAWHAEAQAGLSGAALYCHCRHAGCPVSTPFGRLP